MSLILINIVAPLAAMFVIIGVWTTLHLLAQRRIGTRELGCHGPTVNAKGEAICCKGDKLCENPPDTLASHRH